MPVVPFVKIANSPLADLPQPKEEFVMMAAAQMQDEGRLVEPKAEAIAESVEKEDE